MLTGDQSFVGETVATYRARRDRTLARINAIPGLSCRPPDGAFYLYVNCAGLIGRMTLAGTRLESDSDVVMHLLEAAGVAVVQGTAYGLSPFFRASIATSQSALDEGTDRIARAVAELR
ncbi:aminotransferase class I/II-fold pyridoxal phosphate-dependent enzyme [Bradyrhizobium yuanmingense]|nr:aminotransferase class I/II-fold pyridoxal phosphate-dependent enzyme [Bradyrhizobium yuanmingense]MDF0584223.1 aminotransferase class I/II-fold pyridoxal phosphate-dependent enzyme [Bradyrhizobium yuanmingense]